MKKNVFCACNTLDDMIYYDKWLMVARHESIMKAQKR